MIAQIGPHERLGDICEPEHPVPTDVWRKLFRQNSRGKFVHSGWVKRVEYRKLTDIRDELVKYIKKRLRQEGRDEPVGLEYLVCAGKPPEDTTWPEVSMSQIACFAVTGGKEGSLESHYIHVEVLAANHRHHIFTGKTFAGMDYARKVANLCADALGA